MSLPASRRLLRPGPIALLLVVAALLATGSFLAEPMRVTSISMVPTLNAGDHVLVDKSAYRHSGPARRDLVVFKAPPGAAEAGWLVKRVVAVAGDEVSIEDGALVVNRAVAAEPAIDTSRIDGAYFEPVTVPPGTVFVLGDNRADSIDSRNFGPVSTQSVLGRVAVRLWPRPGAL
jgi:signal peptidase I